MWNLLWSVLCSSLIFVIFNLFKTYRVTTYYAIIGNYVTALIIGLFLYDGTIEITNIISEPWFPVTVFLGMLFIVIFNLMARTSQSMGVSVASVATKMSLIIPVIFAILLYDEPIGGLKLLGIILALAAVYFASIRSGGLRLELKYLYLPILVFLGSGIIDTSMKYMEEIHLKESDYSLFSAFIFGFAALTGLVSSLIKSPKEMIRWNPKNLLGGMILGVPNYFSIYFLLKALQYEGLGSSAIFTINNVGIVMLTTLLGILLFGEQLSKTNWLGILLAVLSIVLVSKF